MFKYLHDYRIKKAKLLLRDRITSITAAAMTGYCKIFSIIMRNVSNGDSRGRRLQSAA
jgi:hypothetical protein